VIDPGQKTRARVLKALTEAEYQIALADAPAMLDSMIRSLKPDIILLNRQSTDFDAISLFMEIRQKFPDKPALLYALESNTAIESLHQAVNMALCEKRKIFGRSHQLPA
jgi:DNA-binding response OmpR family regulator